MRYNDAEQCLIMQCRRTLNNVTSSSSDFSNIKTFTFKSLLSLEIIIPVVTLHHTCIPFIISILKPKWFMKGSNSTKQQTHVRRTFCMRYIRIRVLSLLWSTQLGFEINIGCIGWCAGAGKGGEEKASTTYIAEHLTNMRIDFNFVFTSLLITTMIWTKKGIWPIKDHQGILLVLHHKSSVAMHHSNYISLL